MSTTVLPYTRCSLSFALYLPLLVIPLPFPVLELAAVIPPKRLPPFAVLLPMVLPVGGGAMPFMAELGNVGCMSCGPSNKLPKNKFDVKTKKVILKNSI